MRTADMQTVQSLVLNFEHHARGRKEIGSRQLSTVTYGASLTRAIWRPPLYSSTPSG